MSIRKERIKVYDMTCTSCEKRVERSLNKLSGLFKVKASFSGQFADIEYEDELCSLNQIKSAIKNAGYTTEGSKDYKFIGILVAVVAVVLLGLNTDGFDMDAKLRNASYGVLFIVGVLTSIHCVGMCGGIMLSQSLKNDGKNKFEAMKPAILYNLGRVIAYSILGGIVGAIGSVFSLSITAQAGLQIFAGVFMIMMGLNMAGFSAFRKFQIKLPAAVCKIQSKPKSPLLVGIFNGFMPCGPLQTMQLFALGTGSALAGAFSMFMFALGTVPLMLTFGAISGLLSKGYTKKILKYSGVLIMVLGLIMGNRGFALAGMNLSPKAVMAKIGAFGTDDNAAAPANAVKATIKDGTQILNMTVSGQGYTPNFLYVQKGIPVKWELDAQQLTGCNSTIVIPSLNIKQKLESGKNTIEFTPGDEDLSFSCWMGMLSGTIKVVDDLKTVSSSTSKSSGNDSAASSTSGSAAPSQQSIYGNDISKVATDRLVKKAQVTNNEQTLAVKGIGYELEPLIMVTNTGIPTKLSLDLTAFDQPDGNFTIKDANTQQVITKFVGQKGIVDVGFTIDKAGSYGIYKDENILGMIDVADDLNSVNLDEVRSKYIQQ